MTLEWGPEGSEPAFSRPDSAPDLSKYDEYDFEVGEPDYSTRIAANRRLSGRIMAVGFGFMIGVVIGGIYNVNQISGSTEYSSNYFTDKDFALVGGFKVRQYTPKEVLIKGDVDYLDGRTQSFIQRIEDSCGIEGQLPPDVTGHSLRSFSIHTTIPDCVDKLTK